MNIAPHAGRRSAAVAGDVFACPAGEVVELAGGGGAAVQGGQVADVFGELAAAVGFVRDLACAAPAVGVVSGLEGAEEVAVQGRDGRPRTGPRHGRSIAAGEVTGGDGEDAEEVTGAGGGELSGEFEAEDGVDGFLEGGAVGEGEGLEDEVLGFAFFAAAFGGSASAAAAGLHALFAEGGVVACAEGAIADGEGDAWFATVGEGGAPWQRSRQRRSRVPVRRGM